MVYVTDGCRSDGTFNVAFSIVHETVSAKVLCSQFRVRRASLFSVRVSKAYVRLLTIKKGRQIGRDSHPAYSFCIKITRNKDEDKSPHLQARCGLWLQRSTCWRPLE